MDRSVYERMNENEASHWWFVARREIIKQTIQQLVKLPGGADILEAGCGTGGNLQMLSSMGRVDAFEYDEIAREIASEKAGFPIPFGELPAQIPHGEQKYDLIGLFDVLEHIEDDRMTLSHLGDRLKDGGQLVLTVPALPWLWSRHDEHHHHFRRYTRKSLEDVVKDAGLEVKYSFYANYLLLPVAIALRAAKAALRRTAPDDQLPATWLNATLYRIFAFEKHLVGRARFPIGLSICAIVQKADH